jgi:hypothetical protein
MGLPVRKLKFCFEAFGTCGVEVEASWSDFEAINEAINPYILKRFWIVTEAILKLTRISTAVVDSAVMFSGDRRKSEKTIWGLGLESEVMEKKWKYACKKNISKSEKINKTKRNIKYSFLIKTSL